MMTYNSIYLKNGELQKEVSKEAVKADKLFKKYSLKIILDLGCGTGRNIRYFVKEGYTVSGCDCSNEALELSKLPGIKLCSMSKLPYNNNSFDAVFCNHVIQHGLINQIKETISEIKRVTKDNGLIYLVTSSTKSSKNRLGKEIEKNTRINVGGLDSKIPHHFFTIQELRNLFTECHIKRAYQYYCQSELDPTIRSNSIVIIVNTRKNNKTS